MNEFPKFVTALKKYLCKMTKKIFKNPLTILLLCCIISIVNEKEIIKMFEIAIEMYRNAKGETGLGLVMDFCNENGINFFDVEECAMWA